ncbi:hypothetical protein BT96DRAFT_994467 [Gymnopus androsaceus JB14]|uniref:Uncharacterized protein n=1 Tax=Gymnopus androsaceus JB14 TaxID=1447944 RepID=A0A6A4HMR3_9AGAR|nr:hypothetical protein BT96DRAFT_994467 [Gymnopus androsaceus JB14]
MACRIATSPAKLNASNTEYFYAAIDSQLYTFIGPKPSNFPHIPSITETVDASSYASKWINWTRPGWLRPSSPFMGLSPSSSPFKNEFLKCLDYSWKRVPVELDESGHYRLVKTVQNDWDSLE